MLVSPRVHLTPSPCLFLSSPPVGVDAWSVLGETVKKEKKKKKKWSAGLKWDQEPLKSNTTGLDMSTSVSLGFTHSSSKTRQIILPVRGVSSLAYHLVFCLNLEHFLKTYFPRDCLPAVHSLSTPYFHLHHLCSVSRGVSENIGPPVPISHLLFLCVWPSLLSAGFESDCVRRSWTGNKPAATANNWRWTVMNSCPLWNTHREPPRQEALSPSTARHLLRQWCWSGEPSVQFWPFSPECVFFKQWAQR